mmetsp:Transcript_13471/g.22180  ORF Transcript_13471/g.22180 Transcript_13471/m.22180 type:complete len:227 (-) Transcript_13471:152-832(-)
MKIVESFCEWSPCNSGEKTACSEAVSGALHLDYTDYADYAKARRLRRQRLRTVHCYASSSSSHQGDARIAENFEAGTAGGSSATRWSGSGLSNFFCRTVGRLRTFMNLLAKAIGDPPQRAWRIRIIQQEVQEIQSFAFWLINLCTLCSLISAIMFAASFFIEQSAFADMREQHLLLQPGGVRDNVAGEEKRFEVLARVVGVVVLSLISGCGLGFHHPLQSALLCGL